MKAGTIVMCVREFKILDIPGYPSPQVGKVYTVSHHTDSCGCGSRVALEEFPKGVCSPCGGRVDGVVGWNKKSFIKLSDPIEVTDKKDRRKGVSAVVISSMKKGNQ